MGCRSACELSTCHMSCTCATYMPCTWGAGAPASSLHVTCPVRVRRTCHAHGVQERLRALYMSHVLYVCDVHAMHMGCRSACELSTCHMSCTCATYMPCTWG